jgi:chromosome segregation ATPase
MMSLGLSDKSLEELNILYKELNDKNEQFNEEKRTLTKTIYNVEKNIRNNHDEMRHVLREINRHKEIDESKNIIGEFERNIEGFGLLSEKEVAVITTKMDRTDYRAYGDYPRWIDLERIIKEVIEVKNYYAEWKLTKISKRSKSDTVPPETLYIYEFTDVNGYLINIVSF